MPDAVAVAVRDVLPDCVAVPPIFVHPLFTVEKHTSYDATPLSASDPTFHDADSAVAFVVHVASFVNDVDKSKILPCVGFVGAALSIRKPSEQAQALVFPALSFVRIHV